MGRRRLCPYGVSLNRKGVITVKTYNDLLEAGSDEKSRMSFIQSAIGDHKSSDMYKTAKKARLYYQGENPTIAAYEKVIFDATGKAYTDLFAANHKITSNFFRIVVDQAVDYLMGNGITLKNSASKEKLGPGFEKKAYDAVKSGMIGGISFGFWNFDHLEIFHFADSPNSPGFVPLYDEENGALMAGIRYWQVSENKPLRCTLYEPDGLTEYIKRKNAEMEVMQPKQSYIVHTTAVEADSTRIYTGENYPGFPIVPFRNNEDCRSELCGKQNAIDALDLLTSGMVNNVDEGSVIYWVLRNSDGMDYKDADDFLQMLKRTHIAFMDNTENGSYAEPKTVEVPIVATKTAIDQLKKQLYEDFQALDTSDESINSTTATGINFRYASLDLKCNKLEFQVTEFLQGIFKFAGVEDDPTYTRDKIINKMEEMQTLAIMAPYVDDEYLTTKAMTIMGDADMVEDVLKRRASEDFDRFIGNPKNGNNKPVDDQDIGENGEN